MNIKGAARGFWSWLDDRLALQAVMDFLKQKPIPQNRHTPWMYTGSLLLLFFGIQVLTGILLAFYYRPTLEEATKSIGEIQDQALFKVRPMFASLPGVSAPPPFGGSQRTVVVVGPGGISIVTSTDGSGTSPLSSATASVTSWQ